MFFLIYGGYLVTVKFKKKQTNSWAGLEFKPAFPYSKNLNGLPMSCPWEIHQWACTGSAPSSCPSVWPSEGTQLTAPLSALSPNSCVAVGKSLSFSVLFPQL